MSGFLGLNASSQSTPTSFSFGSSSALVFGGANSGGSFMSSALGSTGLFAGVSSSPSSLGVSSSFGTPSSQGASTPPIKPFFAYSLFSSAAPSSSSEALSMFGVSSSVPGNTNAEPSTSPVSSAASFGAPPSGPFSVFGGSLGESGFGFGATTSSAAATTSATVMSSVAAASSGIDPSLLFGGSKPVNPAFGIDVGIPLYNPPFPAAPSDSRFGGSSAYSSSHSTPVSTTLSSPPGFPNAAIPSATAFFGSTSQSTIAIASPSSATTMSPISDFSFGSSATSAVRIAPTSGSSSATPITTLGRPQASSSSQFGVSKFSSTTAGSVPASSSLFNMAPLSHPASISAMATLASASGVSFPSSAPSASASASPAASSGFAFATSTLASSAASDSSGAVNFGKVSTSGVTPAATLVAIMATATPAAAVSSTLATSAAGAVGALSTTPTQTAMPPSEIVGKTVEEIIKGWTHELQERTSMFRKQAEFLGEWDGRILGNRNLLIKLESEVASVVELQHSVERQLELVDTHQQEVEKSLDTLEEEAEELYRNERPSFLEDEAAASRDLMFEQAEFVDRELERMGEQVKTTIRNLNDVQGGDFDVAEGASPFDLVVRILNNQLTSLLWIDKKTGEFSAQMQLIADQGALLDKGNRGSRLRLL